MSCLLAQTSTAGSWTVNPFLELIEYYSDNIFLDSSDEASDFVTEIAPGIEILGNGSRYDFLVNYRAQNLIYADHGKFNTTNHQLYSNSTLELIDDELFVAGGVSLTQQNTRNIGRRSLDNINPDRNGDRDDVLIYNVSPYWLHRFGSFANSELRFTYDGVDGDRADGFGGRRNTPSTRVLASLTSGSHFQILPWYVRFDRQHIDEKRGAQDIIFQSYEGGVDYVINNRVALLGVLGYDDNDFVTRGRDPTGLYWRVGGRWTPSSRTTLTALFGDRYFGHDYQVDYRHRSRRTTWFATFSRGAATTRQRQIDQAQFDNAGRNVFLDQNNDPIPLVGDLPNLVSEVYIGDSITGGVSFAGRRDELTLRGFYNSRDFQVSRGEERQYGVSAYWNHSLNRSTDLDFGVQWQKRDFQTGNEDERFVIDAGIAKQLGKRLSVFLSYRRADRSAGSSVEEYVENRVVAGAKITLQ